MLGNKYSFSYSNKTGSTITSSVISIVINVALMIYVLRLEANHCNCVRDWRHMFIKIYSGIMIVVNTFLLFGFKLLGNTNSRLIGNIIKLLIAIYIVASIVDIYSVITYIGDINDTNCQCAVKDMAKLNKSMIVLRWFYISMLILAGILILNGLEILILGKLTKASN